MFTSIEIPPATPGELNRHSTLNLHPFQPAMVYRMVWFSCSQHMSSPIILGMYRSTNTNTYSSHGLVQTVYAFYDHRMTGCPEE